MCVFGGIFFAANSPSCPNAGCSGLEMRRITTADDFPHEPFFTGLGSMNFLASIDTEAWYVGELR